MLEQLYYIPVDKLLHFIVGMLITIIISSFYSELIIKTKYKIILNISLVIFIAFSKEFYDEFFKYGWDTLEFFVTILGGLIPLLIKYFFKLIKKIW